MKKNTHKLCKFTRIKLTHRKQVTTKIGKKNGKTRYRQVWTSESNYFVSSILIGDNVVYFSIVFSLRPSQMCIAT